MSTAISAWAAVPGPIPKTEIIWGRNRFVYINLRKNLELGKLRALHPRKEGVQQKIADIAYILYEQRGKAPGHELDDWLEAERRILGKQKR